MYNICRYLRSFCKIIPIKPYYIHICRHICPHCADSYMQHIFVKRRFIFVKTHLIFAFSEKKLF